MPDKELVKSEGTTDVAKSLTDMFAEDAGGGLQNLGANDFAIPFYCILQKGSPQVSRANAKYIKNAVAGMIMNNVSGEIIPGEPMDDEPGGLLFIPCGYEKKMVRWKSRESGGGLVCSYAENDPVLKKFSRNERGQLFDPETKDIIVDTAYHYGIIPVEGGFPQFGVVSMTSTQLKVSRNWNTTMRSIMKKGPNGAFNPPSYSHVYRLTTIGQTKDQFDWYGWKITSEGEVEDIDLYKIAREFAKQVLEGAVRVTAPPQEFDEEASVAHATGEGVPF